MHFLKILHNTVDISINNFISTHFICKIVIYIVEGNYIQQNQRDLRVYIESIDEKSPVVYTSVFWFVKTLIQYNKKERKLIYNVYLVIQQIVVLSGIKMVRDN